MGRIGTKHSDRRWEEDGVVFASKLEALVFARLKGIPGLRIRRCSTEQGDTFGYTSSVRGGRCGLCGSGDIVQQRVYTPDFRVTGHGSGGDERGFYLETKGYFPGPQRNLLRAFLKTGPKIDLRLVLERDGRATSSLTQLEYATKYLKIPVHIWDNTLPKYWLDELRGEAF